MEQYYEAQNLGTACELQIKPPTGQSQHSCNLRIIELLFSVLVTRHAHPPYVPTLSKYYKNQYKWNDPTFDNNSNNDTIVDNGQNLNSWYTNHANGPISDKYHNIQRKSHGPILHNNSNRESRPNLEETQEKHTQEQKEKRKRKET